MERMEREERRSTGDSRRNISRNMAQERAGRRGDRATLNTIVLIFLVALAAVASYAGMEISIGTVKDLTALTVFLYIVTALVYRNRYERGKMRGRLDPDYIEAVKCYRDEREEVYRQGLGGEVNSFCREYKSNELREYRMNLLADVDVEYDDYAKKYRHLSFVNILKIDLPWSVKRTLIRCNRARPLRLTQGMLMNENGEADRYELLRQSGQEKERSDKRRQMFERAVIIMFGCVVAIDIILGFSPDIIVRWAMRMLPIALAVVTGDDAGYCCMTVTEVNFKRDQVTVLKLLREQKKINEEFSMIVETVHVE